MAVCIDCIVSQLVRLTEMPCLAGTFLVQGLIGPMKWLVQPESTMARLSLDGLRAGTRVLQEYKIYKRKEFLGLTVPSSYQEAGFKFLFVPPFPPGNYLPSGGRSLEWDMCY